MKQSAIFLIVAILLVSNLGSANHIIGGNMSYQHLENNRYSFTLTLYRDCSCINCADFDIEAVINVYHCGNLLDCTTLGQFDYDQIKRVPLSSKIDVPAFEHSDLIIPATCLQKGIYEFELTFPSGTENTYVIYQRCCRPQTLSNLIQPGNIGMSIFAELSPAAVQENNNNPIFNNSFSPVLCLDEMMEIDQQAIDPDGDSLVYSLCHAFSGGGIVGGPEAPFGNVNSCGGILPDPACPPPYTSVSYAPGFSADQPIGPDTEISMNPQNGILSVKASIAGNFLLNICIQEYRSGALINTTFREFTFLAAECQTVGVLEELSRSKIKITPNPADQFLEITTELADPGSYKVQVFNSYGQCIASEDMHSRYQKIQSSSWPSGVYQLLILYENKFIARKSCIILH